MSPFSEGRMATPPLVKVGDSGSKKKFCMSMTRSADFSLSSCMSCWLNGSISLSQRRVFSSRESEVT